nr:ABC transporter ATP-binding protein [uncultured Cellulosilyticum sp.]
MGKKEKSTKQCEYSVFQNMMYTMKGTFQFQKPLIALLIVYTITSAILPFIPTVTVKLVIEQIQNKVSWQQLLAVVLMAHGVMLILKLLDIYCNHMTWWRYIDSRMKFMLLRVHKVLNMNFECLEMPKVLDSCQKAMRATTGNTNGLEGMMRSFQMCMSTLLKIVISIGILFTLSPWMVVLLVVLGMLNFWNMDAAKKWDKVHTWDPLAPYWRKNAYMQNTVSDFNYGKDIRLFSMKGWIMEKYEHLHGEIYKKMVGSRNRWMLCGIYNQLIILFQQGTVYGYLIYCVLYKEMSIADFSLYLGTAQTFFYTLYSIFNGVTDMREQSREINDFRSFLEFQDGQEIGDIQPLVKAEQYEFVFENVSFKYPNTASYALKNLNLTLKPGERLAVVGLNGAGKTTFIKLLCRLYEPTEGRILLNGTDIRKFERKAYYELFSPVFQNIEVFAFSFAENVAMREERETKEDFAEACLKMAGLGEKLDALSKGVKTQLLKIISEEGIDLSGGEKQKLAFARALYKNAPIVILDEPTAALDALAEYRMYQNFDKLIGGKSAVYISHRLSSTRFCDHVAMFENGQLIEYGTHASLLADGGAYARMFAVQAHYYEKEGGAVYES